MRFRIICETERIPVNYLITIVSYIKKALSAYNPEYYEEIYLFDGRKNKKSKNFTFSVYIKDFKREGNDLLTKEIHINVSSPDEKFIFNLYNGFMRTKEYCFKKKYKIRNKSIKILKEEQIKSNYVMFKTLSPIAIKDKNGKFIDLDNPEYEETLNYIADLTLKNFRGYGLQKKLSFVPIDMKKVIIKEEIETVQQRTQRPYLCVNSFKGVFALRGNSEDLNMLYRTGIGFRRNQGYGMVELA